jgi:hypothetical protein
VGWISGKAHSIEKPQFQTARLGALSLACELSGGISK